MDSHVIIDFISFLQSKFSSKHVKISSTDFEGKKPEPSATSLRMMEDLHPIYLEVDGLVRHLLPDRLEQPLVD